MAFAVLGGLLAVLAHPAVAADEPLRLEPRTDWVLDYAQERCSLHRGFGEGDTSVNLRIDWFGPGTSHRFLVVGPAVPNFRTATSDVRVRFTPDVEPRELMGLNGTYQELPAVSFGSFIRPQDPDVDWERMSPAEQREWSATPKPHRPDFERQVTSLEMRFADGKEIVLALGSMAKPLEAMRGCMDNLVSVWGLDPSVQRSLTRLAVPKPSTIRRVQRRYPFTQLMTGTNAFVPVRVLVDGAGKVNACVVQNEAVDESFIDAVCDGLARGYEPARDSSGNSVPSVFTTSVFYFLD